MKFRNYLTEAKFTQKIRAEAEGIKSKFQKHSKDFDNPNNREGAKKIVKGAEMVLKMLDALDKL